MVVVGGTSLTPPLASRRTGEAWRSDRLMLNKEVLSPQVVEGFVPLLSQVGEDFIRRARAQVGKSGREYWTADFTHELFRFALECECQRQGIPPHALKCPLAGGGQRATFPPPSSLEVKQVFAAGSGGVSSADKQGTAQHCC